MFQTVATKQLLKALDKLEKGSLQLRLPDGKKIFFEGRMAGEKADIFIHNIKAIECVAKKGDIGLAESYRDGLWSTENLPALLTLALQNEKALQPFIYGGSISQMLARFRHFLNRNTRAGSRRNIHAHYDLGNDFYELWLDKTMSYSAAIYETQDEALEVAQHKKYDRMIDRLGRTSGNLLEVGCGWGGFAERASEKGDFGIKGITLSTEQQLYAQQRLNDKADIRLEDYRDQKGRFDHIVSIEMFEAVGEAFWPTYFDKLQSLLATRGKALIQTITIEEPYFEKYRSTGDFIREYIFPGGMLPTTERFRQEASKAGLAVADVFHFGQDYARTLREWLAAFDAKLPEVSALGYDEGFIRMWRFYLSACIASFDTKRTNVMQVELVHA